MRRKRELKVGDKVEVMVPRRGIVTKILRKPPRSKWQGFVFRNDENGKEELSYIPYIENINEDCSS